MTALPETARPETETARPETARPEMVPLAIVDPIPASVADRPRLARVRSGVWWSARASADANPIAGAATRAIAAEIAIASEAGLATLAGRIASGRRGIAIGRRGGRRHCDGSARGRESARPTAEISAAWKIASRTIAGNDPGGGEDEPQTRGATPHLIRIFPNGTSTAENSPPKKVQQL